MDIALAQLALVFMPGIIWANIDVKYGAGLKPSQTSLFLRAFLFGMATYSALFVIYRLCGKNFGYPSLDNSKNVSNLIELKDEIAWSIPLSFVLSTIWLWVVRFKILMKFLHAIGATRRYGDEDVWSYTLNSDQAEVEYVHLRDIKNGFIFAGWVNTYSESEPYRELLLRDVIIYNDQGTQISAAPFLYLSRPKDDIWIEFPYSKKGQDDVGKKDNNKRRFFAKRRP